MHPWCAQVWEWNSDWKLELITEHKFSQLVTQLEFEAGDDHDCLEDLHAASLPRSQLALSTVSLHQPAAVACLMLLVQLAPFKITCKQAQTILDLTTGTDTHCSFEFLDMLVALLSRISDLHNLKQLIQDKFHGLTAPIKACMHGLTERCGNWLFFDPAAPAWWGLHRLQLDHIDDQAFLKYIAEQTERSEFFSLTEVMHLQRNQDTECFGMVGALPRRSD